MSGLPQPSLTQPAHSRIGASSMSRWSKCPGSVKLSVGIEGRSSPYAEEGTKAHELAEKILWHGFNNAHTNEYPAEMVEAVRVYTEYVGERLSKITEPFWDIEHRFDLSKLYPGLFGTADCVIYDPDLKTLEVIDYKHGAGIAVEVESNPQLMYYGLGALMTLPLSVKTIKLTVAQPRCSHPSGPIRSWVLPAIEFLNFAADLVEFAKATEDPNAPLVPGEHCRFCPAVGICPATKKKAQELAKLDFAPNEVYDSTQLSKALEWLPTVEGWAKGVREFAYNEMMAGKVIPGWKLVDKRATRRWRNEKEVKDAFDPNGEDSYIYEEPKLKSPAQLEKIIDKKELAPFIVSESSGLSLVPDTDKRAPAKRDAKADFIKLPLDSTEESLGD